MISFPFDSETRRTAILLLVWTLSLMVVSTVQAQQPASRTAGDEIRAASRLPQATLSSLSNDSLRRAARDDAPGPYRYARLRSVDVSPSESGTWEQLPSGEWLWRYRVQSPSAHSLSLKFDRLSLPDQAALYVYGPDYEVVRGPYTTADRTRGVLWTPEVPGDRVTVELTVPADARDAVRLHLATLGHAFRSLQPSPRNGPQTKARACNIDVACPEADPWSNQIRSVGLYTFTDDGFRGTCTGTLVNNTEQDATPYFMTAEHCLQGSESAAASMTFYWNYDHPTCRPPGSQESGDVSSVERSEQTSSGALLRMSYGNCEDTEGSCYPGDIAGKPDMTLVEIDESIPATYDLYLSGWSRVEQPPSESTTIHHPSGHAKRITFENDPASIDGGFGQSGDSHLTVQYDAGTTEGGSSGAALFGPQKRVRGVLSGGQAGCQIRDWFGRVSEAWVGGGTPSTGLQNWLAPSGSNPSAIDGRSLNQDNEPPAPVRAFSVQSASADSVTLSWQATGDDGRTGTAQRYDLRYRTDHPITSQSAFTAATQVQKVPQPKSAGTRQSTTIGVGTDTTYYFAMVAIDDAANASPLTALGRDVTPVPSLQISPPAPQPARSQATLSVAADEEQTVRAELYDAMGRRVSVLFDDRVPAFQRRRIQVDVSQLASGMYFLRVRGTTSARTEQLVVVK